MSGLKDKYIAVIGLEVHAQLLTKSKIYASDSNEFGQNPNTNVSVISLAHPGALPKLNKRVVELAIKMGLACDSAISREQIFDRKNYFYPDLPKGYQLTQDRTPICVGGKVDVNSGNDKWREIRLNRIHIEEDAGKSVHLEDEQDTLVDLNRAGVPLIEIVTEPDLCSSTEAGSFLTEVRRLVRYLEICDGNMEQGSMRCDANVSIMLSDSTEFGCKVEIKNLNSIKNVQKAIDFEIARQIKLVENGDEVISETRLYNADVGKTYGMRTKEELNDYRYFPDPDLSPLYVSEEWLSQIKSEMPILPWELRAELTEKYGLPVYDAGVISDSKILALFFLDTAKRSFNYKSISNWIMGPIKSYQNDKSTESLPLTSIQLQELIDLIDSDKISFTIASQKLFPVIAGDGSKSAIQMAEELNLFHDKDSNSIDQLVDQLILDFPDKVKEYRSSKRAKGLIGMFMGELMKRSGGKVDPKAANRILVKKLG